MISNKKCLINSFSYLIVKICFFAIELAKPLVKHILSLKNDLVISDLEIISFQEL